MIFSANLKSCRVNNLKRLGFMTGEISVPDDFDTIESEQLISMFEGKKS